MEERQHYREDLERKQRESDARERVFREEQEDRDKIELKEYRKSLVFKVR